MFKTIFAIAAVFSALTSASSFAGSSRSLLDCGTTRANVTFLQESTGGDPSKGAICFITFLGGVQNLACPTLIARTDLGQSIQFTYKTGEEKLNIVLPKSLNALGGTGTATVTGQVRNENGEVVNVDEVLNCNGHAGADLVFGLSVSSD